MTNSKKEILIPVFKEISELFHKQGFYGDCNYYKKKEQRTIVTKTTTNVDNNADEGVKIRVWDGKTYLEYGTTSLDSKTLLDKAKTLLDKAKKNSTTYSSTQEISVDRTELEKEYLKDVVVEKSLEEKIEILQKNKDKVLASRESVVNAKTAIIEELEEHLFVNYYKNLYQEIPLCIFVRIANVMCDDQNLRTAFEAYTNTTFEQAYEKANAHFEGFVEKISQKERAQRLKGGRYHVLLTPKLTGLLAHESFGHGMEADTMMKDRALASEWVGKKIGSDEVSIVDYSAIPGKNGEFYFDHEGNLAKETHLVKNGIISTPMADSYSKTKLKLNQSNNSRFESFDHKNYTRMSNTYFEKGSTPYVELLESIEDGILVTDSSGGMEDPKGWGVQIQGNFGQRIKNGKLVDEFYDGFTLTGFLPEIIKNIEGVSNEFEIDGAGSCGKGHKEWVRVSEGGPYLKIKEVMLG